jgi:trehalose-6-phosphate synthase
LNLPTQQPQQPKIVIVSNRGPFSFAIKDGKTVATRGDGGLVTAITSVARQYDVLWISCALSRGDTQWLASVGNETQTIEEMQIRLTIT